ncbi:MAG: helix-turn-helix domain containing protein [Planctomycetaceae bacterium]|nr:helix-turn-helix domain containing protein [Planctomycetaceae bacterium]
MYPIKLTDKEFETLQKEQFSYPDPRVCLKINAILLVAQNVERKLICTHLGIKRNTLVPYVKLFLAEGVEGLKQNRYRKPVSPLKDHVEPWKDILTNIRRTASTKPSTSLSD